jgi:hypothetical protein
MSTNLSNEVGWKSAKISCIFVCYQLRVGFLLGLLFDHEDEDGTIVWRAIRDQVMGGYVPEYRTLCVFIFQYIGEPENSLSNAYEYHGFIVT